MIHAIPYWMAVDTSEVDRTVNWVFKYPFSLKLYWAGNAGSGYQLYAPFNLLIVYMGVCRKVEEFVSSRGITGFT